MLGMVAGLMFAALTRNFTEPMGFPNAVEAKVEGEAPEGPAKEAAWPTEVHRREEFQVRGNQD